MKNIYKLNSFVLLIAAASLFSYAFGMGVRSSKADSNKLGNKIFLSKTDKSYLKNGIHVPLPPLKPGPANVVKGSNVLRDVTVTANSGMPRFEPDKTLSNVQVYPNPITDQINLRYNVAKNSNVTIKIMDVLGNNVITLFSQRVDPGEQKVTFNLNNRLSSGFYFVRLIVGSESVIKRISILAD